ncbi:transcription elongation factor GreA [Bacilli bacterium PM5-3]|nr:transcription elongation factor GreA [Bacilli bacterium PM5-3]MDH6603494.1 transcription elongation factor GreA [Bacilli bacterium PM5-9]
MEEKILLTKEGVAKLEAERENLINVERPQVIEELQAARAQGDLSENADYDAARDKQAAVEERIKEVGYMLDHYTLIDEKKGGVKKVSLGATVTILDLDDDVEKTYTIVGSIESDPDQNKISNQAPLAKKIDGKKVGDVVLIETSDYQYKIQILKIERK